MRRLLAMLGALALVSVAIVVPVVPATPALATAEGCASSHGVPSAWAPGAPAVKIKK